MKNIILILTLFASTVFAQNNLLRGGSSGGSSGPSTTGTVGTNIAVDGCITLDGGSGANSTYACAPGATPPSNATGEWTVSKLLTSTESGCTFTMTDGSRMCNSIGRYMEWGAATGNLTFSSLGLNVGGTIINATGATDFLGGSGFGTTGRLTMGSGDDIVLSGGGAMYFNGVGTPALVHQSGSILGTGNIIAPVFMASNNNGDGYECNSGSTCYVNVARYRMNSVPFIYNTNPTVASGFCTSPIVTNGSGTAAFLITIGSACAAAVGTLTLPAANTGWTCNVRNTTSVAAADANVPVQTGGTTTTADFKNYARTTGLASNWTASDVLRFDCAAY